MTAEFLPIGFKYGLVGTAHLEMGHPEPVATFPLDDDNRTTVQQIGDALAYYTDSVLERRLLDSGRWEVVSDLGKGGRIEMSERELTVLDLRDYLAELRTKRGPIAERAAHDPYVWARRVLEAHDAEIARAKTQLTEYEQLLSGAPRTEESHEIA
ncbi:hypothetical protein [Amycolatopsis sp. TNS106]|uniref:hypothetical protein n=1 Tax=Amycolatopsis sp. TNS106 TaxID=2861750 RepID=UPI001C56EC99|nr:hypothetical protein [Amycolatopsis sp. TNS106]QXV57370.1 hypothetical protein CVV72_10330 [Amycolatopsis sp. TNS106]